MMSRAHVADGSGDRHRNKERKKDDWTRMSEGLGAGEAQLSEVLAEGGVGAMQPVKQS